MKKTFREYHQFSKEEFKELWNNCLFVFDANTLLDMYRYSRETVDAYIQVLSELKAKKQLWIPHQVGYEFFENRVVVIHEFEKSYDEIQSIIDRAKTDIESRYKKHPFLDLGKIKEDMDKGLAGVEAKIKQAKESHPKWLEKDEVLERLCKVFEGSIGKAYSKKQQLDIMKEGKERYEKKIPPGYKDDPKPEDRKFGDLILWYQIIDKAKEAKKPIIFISGDVKEDWQMRIDGKIISPLPKLKREILDKAGADLHIYTADQFLELSKIDAKAVDKKAIQEVKTIRELDEEKTKTQNLDLIERDKDFIQQSYFYEYTRVLDKLRDLITVVKEQDPDVFREINHLFYRMRDLQNRLAHHPIDHLCINKIYSSLKETSFLLSHLTRSDDIEVSIGARRLTRLIDHLNYTLNRHY